MKLHLYINALCLSAVLSACAQSLPDSVTSTNKKSSTTNSSSNSGNVLQVDPTGGTPAVTGGSATGTTPTIPVILDKSGGIVMSGSSYFLRNVGSKNCLDVTGAATDNGTLLQPYACGAGYTNQIWTVTINSDASLTFTSADSGRCLDLDFNNVLAADAAIQIWDCSGQPNQNFKLTASNGGYRLSPMDGLTQAVSEKSGQILGESITNGAEQAYVLIPGGIANPQN